MKKVNTSVPGVLSGALVLWVGLSAQTLTPQSRPGDQSFRAELFEDLPKGWRDSWSFDGMNPAITWSSPAMGVTRLPAKVSPAGLTMHRVKPFALRITGIVNLPAGEYEFSLRSRMYARFFVDDNLVLQSVPPKPEKLTAAQVAAQEAAEKKARDEAAQKAADQQAREELLRRKLEDANQEQNEAVKKAVNAELEKASRPPEKSDTQPPAEMETVVQKVTIQSGVRRLRMEVTGRSLNREVSIVFRRGDEMARLMTSVERVPYTEKAWADWSDAEKQRQKLFTEELRRPLWKQWDEGWKQRHARQTLAAVRGSHLGQQIDRIINAKLAANHVQPAPLTDDYQFARRAYLDLWGLVPTAEEVREFVVDVRKNKRELLIDRLLADDRWADPWVSYWEDALAENPKLFGAVPNSTGPFKDWIYRSFVENRGYDRFATELILMEGTPQEFGTLGFRESVDNDAPLAEKAHVISQAFMAANLKCARCHDSPLNAFRQQDLFGLAAMLSGDPVVIPASSSVGEVPGRRKPAISVTSKPGDRIPPSFVFDSSRAPEQIHGSDRDYRLALADWLTSHRRFAEVGVNIVWKRFMGTGLVEPADDWGPKPKISHPELLAYLVDELTGSGYSIKYIEELIVKSQAYQRRRVSKPAELKDAGSLPLFAAQPTRRMRAEEVVDSLHRIVRREFRSERIAYQAVDFGHPKRTWQVVTLSNEEDNAVLVKPLLQEIITTAKAFGWRDQRPDPVCVRNTDPNPLQPLAIANGELSGRLVRLTDQSHFTWLSNQDSPLPAFTDNLFLNTLSRPPEEREREWVYAELEPVWANRRIPPDQQRQQIRKAAPQEITIGDTAAAQEYIMKIREGEPPTASLREAYRKRLEDILWTTLNSPEFLFVP